MSRRRLCSSPLRNTASHSRTMSSMPPLINVNIESRLAPRGMAMASRTAMASSRTPRMFNAAMNQTMTNSSLASSRLATKEDSRAIRTQAPNRLATMSKRWMRAVGSNRVTTPMESHVSRRNTITGSSLNADAENCANLESGRSEPIRALMSGRSRRVNGQAAPAIATSPTPCQSMASLKT